MAGCDAEGGARGAAAASEKVSVVIPTWMRAAWLERCLDALGCQDPLPDEVVVVTRPCDEAASRVVQERTRNAPFALRLATVERPGHVAPVRRGLEEARGEIVAFLDDDAEPEPGWLAALRRPFADRRVACVGGHVSTPGFRGKVRRDAGRVRWYGKHVGNVGALEGRGPAEVDGVMEGNWAWRTPVLRSLTFDSVLDFDDASMYGLDLCLQAKARGLRVVYEPEARVLHHAAPRDPSLDRADRDKRVFAYSRNYTYVAMRHLRGPRRAVFLGWWWLVGERGSYGVAKAVLDLLLRGTGVRRQIGASFAGKREGMRVWRRARG
jgi:GT2 family glycosyltransferase